MITLEDQVALCQRNVLLKPHVAEAHFDLAMAYLDMERYEAAVACFRQAVSLNADYAEAFYRLGYTYSLLGRFHDALVYCRQAVNLKPDYAEACNNIGYSYLNLVDPDAALVAFRQAAAAMADYAKAYYNIGLVLTGQGQVVAALTNFDRALRIQPDEVATHDNKIMALNYLAGVPPETLLMANDRYAALFETPLRSVWPAHTNGRDPGRRLKIGYVSPDFRLHSVAYFMEPILAHHDKGQVEVYCYYSHMIQDAVTARLRGYADWWVPCKGLTDEQLAERIRADGIDILVDLAGHTGGNRLRVFARKPAPVQVSYLGYPATTGLTAMDYRLVTVDTDPVGAEAWHSERLYRLPRSLWCYRPEAGMPDVAVETPARRNGYITFGSLNNIAKISDVAVEAWSRLLQAVPGSRLVMTQITEGWAWHVMQERFAARGISADRLQLHGRLAQTAYQGLLQDIDIALDTYPYNGTTTTCQLLWMGIPVVSLAGRSSVSRSGYALLKGLGLEGLVAQDEGEYVSIAAALARDLSRLTELHATLRGRFAASALRDEVGFTRDLEAAYRDMWREWCRRAGGRE